MPKRSVAEVANTVRTSRRPPAQLITGAAPSFNEHGATWANLGAPRTSTNGSRQKTRRGGIGSWVPGRLEPAGAMEDRMNEDRFNMELRKFLKEVGVTSQREVE